MFMLYALVVGVAAGWLVGGRLMGLSTMSLRWAPLALAGLLAQVVLFFGPVAERIGDAGTAVYLGSTALVLVVVLRNLGLPGLPLIALGTVSNLAAIVANGGSMPASPAALALVGHGINAGYSNSTVGTDPALWLLTDIFAIPAPLPYANVFSIGDVVIGLGIAVAVVTAMQAAGARGNLPTTYPHPGTDGS
jgi:hypothetical protein